MGTKNRKYLRLSARDDYYNQILNFLFKSPCKFITTHYGWNVLRPGLFI
jgi:hypothetical protein